ncbi:MAG: hypothetical protein LBV41_04520 [Cytophagaceae bacterium]|jgi:acetyltransferase-like isoleucine patch superfamily enzyme|nr:hypothetical protein [Cytophagaceae bacterium]
MIYSNLLLGKNVDIDPTASFNNVKLGDGVKIGKKVTIFGSPDKILEVGSETEIGEFTIVNGYAAQLKIGARCSIGIFCHFIVDTGPTASPKLLKKYPIAEALIMIGNDCIIGHGTMVIAGSVIGDCCYVMPNSFVNCEIPPYSVYGGSPAKFIRKITPEELS